MKIYRLVVPNLQQRINNIVELISDIKDPNSANMDTDNENNNNMRTNESTLVDSVNPERNLIEDNEMEQDSPTTSTTTTTTTNKLNPREIALKIAEIKFQKLNYKDEFDKLYRAFKSDSSIDINQLSELRTKIAECEEQITSLQDQLMHGCNTNTPKIIINTPSTPQQQQQQTPVIQVEEEEEIDPIICIDHCLRLAICLLQDIELKAITPHIRSLFENLILTNISSVDEQIRVLAVRALNLICILKIDIAQKYVPLLLEMIQRDKKQVIIEAFKSLINCIMAYSLNRLVSSDDDIDEDTTSTNNTTSKRKSLANQTNDSFKSEASTKILSIMTKLLDFEDSEITTMAVEGFCKLFMTGHILSAKLFSKLLIMYYSPMTENDTQLRAILTCFLPQFAFFRSSNQLCVEESFMLTVKCLINAGPDNYLSEIDLNKVTEILFNLTNPKNLLQKHHQQRIVQSNNICHENIFRSICYEILKDDNSFKLKTYLKLLQLADLTSADYLSLKSIHELIEEVHDVFIIITKENFFLLIFILNIAYRR
jgi:condensin complex subunit 3